MDGNISKAVYLDICNQMNYITIFLLGFGLTAVDEHGMKEVIRRGRWFNLVIGKKIIYYFISRIHQSILKTSWSFCNDMVVYLCFVSLADTTKK